MCFSFENFRFGTNVTLSQSSIKMGEEELDEEWSREYRSITARCNYLAADRPDIGYAAKELCRDFSQPSTQSVVRLKRVVRYLIGREAVAWRFVWQDDVTESDLWTYR